MGAPWQTSLLLAPAVGERASVGAAGGPVEVGQAEELGVAETAGGRPDAGAGVCVFHVAAARYRRGRREGQEDPVPYWPSSRAATSPAMKSRTLSASASVMSNSRPATMVLAELSGSRP